MTPQEIKAIAPPGATHYDFVSGKPVYFKKNHLGYTFRSEGSSWVIALGIDLNNYRKVM